MADTKKMSVYFLYKVVKESGKKGLLAIFRMYDLIASKRNIRRCTLRIADVIRTIEIDSKI